ncbi:hypothetical protein CDZ98_00560 [Mameliella alba]|nr:hypothetical protein CDZ98_00560 [Mameliella alba]
MLGFGVEDETALEDKRLAVIGDEAACAERNMFAGKWRQSPSTVFDSPFRDILASHSVLTRSFVRPSATC